MFLVLTSSRICTTPQKCAVDNSEDIFIRAAFTTLLLFEDVSLVLSKANVVFIFLLGRYALLENNLNFPPFLVSQKSIGKIIGKGSIKCKTFLFYLFSNFSVSIRSPLPQLWPLGSAGNLAWIQNFEKVELHVERNRRSFLEIWHGIRILFYFRDLKSVYLYGFFIFREFRLKD